MISPSEQAYILKHAYVPEHMVDYVSSISKTEPFLIGDFVVHVHPTHLIFVGYPLGGESSDTQIASAFAEAQERFVPAATSLIAPWLPAVLERKFVPSSTDEYYRLALTSLEIPKKVRNMLKRASKEVTIGTANFSKEHKKLVRLFLRKTQLDTRTRFIFQRVPAYARRASTLVYEARNARGDLVAFDIADFGARDYAFYMFNFRSPRHRIPGVSDLLLASIIKQTQKDGKPYLNLGLGINDGISFFKKKWGATRFLEYSAWKQKPPDGESWLDAFYQLSK